MRGRVLIIAGSDSGGGAGIQADIKTVTALEGYAATAISALTVQNTREVRDVMPVPPGFVVSQMETVLDDIGADCLKTGMLHDAPVIEAVAAAIARLAADRPLVVDPVMVAQSGAQLLAVDAVESLRSQLLPLATVVTPNIPEAEVLLGEDIPDTDAMRAAAARLRERLGTAVLLKGGHMAGEQLRDVLVDAAGGETIYEGPRIETTSTHGTGCTLASAIATGLAQGLSIPVAVQRAREYLRLALEAAPGLGGGHGPVNHGHTVMPFAAPGKEGPGH